jgi:hypothetical protein
MNNLVKLAVAACCISMFGFGAHAADTPPALAPFYQFADAMNAGDMAKAAALYATSAPIIDEFAPHHWNSFGDWTRDFGNWAKANGVEGLHIALSEPSHKEVGAGQAYAVVPTTLTFKMKDKPGSEKGLFTFATEKTASGWRITSWAWSTL